MDNQCFPWSGAAAGLVVIAGQRRSSVAHYQNDGNQKVSAVLRCPPDEIDRSY